MQPLPLLPIPARRAAPSQAGGRQQRLGIWSIQWAADSREIIAGTSDPGVRVYDMMQVRWARWACCARCVS